MVSWKLRWAVLLLIIPACIFLRGGGIVEEVPKPRPPSAGNRPKGGSSKAVKDATAGETDFTECGTVDCWKRFQQKWRHKMRASTNSSQDMVEEQGWGLGGEEGGKGPDDVLDNQSEEWRTLAGGCPDVPAASELREVHHTWLFSHGGQVPRGEALRYAHMATIALLPNSTLIAAWQASKLYEGAEDQRIYYTLSLDGAVGERWAAPRQLPVTGTKGAQWSPALFVDPETGSAWLFYSESVGKHCIRPAEGKHPELWVPGGDIKATYILPDGTGWETPRTVLSQSVDKIPKVIANPPIVTDGGRWVLPYWTEKKNLPKIAGCGTTTAESAGVLVSTDGGDSWQRHGTLVAKGTHLIEGTVAEAGNQLLMMFRTEKGVHYHARSRRQDGEEWAQPTPTRVNNPDSKPHMIHMKPEGELLLAYNNHRGCCDAGCRKCRTQLTIARSGDGGHKWSNLHVIAGHHTTFLRTHYPTMLQVGCRLLVAYSSAYSCCAPESARLGIRVVSYELMP